MKTNFERIAVFGFKRVGSWMINADKLKFAIEPNVSDVRDVLYAFVVDGALVYIGKTTQRLKERLQRYKTPAKNLKSGGSTNFKNNNNIRNCLSNGQTVEIYAWHDKSQNQYNGLKVNFAAAIEDSLISDLSPPWNGSVPNSLSCSEQGTDCIPTETQDTEKDQNQNKPAIPPTSDSFRTALSHILFESTARGASHVDVCAGDLHRSVGGYPGRGNRMPVCCSVMRQEMRDYDSLISAPPSGNGASLIIRYRLPRG